MSKKDLGRLANRGATNARIWFTESGAPGKPVENDLWLPSEYNPTFQYVNKSSTYTHNSNTTMTSDPHITFTFPADGIWEIHLHATVYGPTAADVKFDWFATGGVALLAARSCIGPAISMTGTTDTTVRISKHGLLTGVTYGTEPVSTSEIREAFLVETSGGEGTLTLRHAQRVSTASNTYITNHTYATAKQVGGDKSAIMKYDAGWNMIL